MSKSRRGGEADLVVRGSDTDTNVRNADNMSFEVGVADQVLEPSFFVGATLAAGDFGLSRLRYDSPSITRS